MARKSRKQLEKKKQKEPNFGLLRLWAKIVGELEAAYMILLDEDTEAVKKLKVKYKDHLTYDEFSLAYWTLQELGKNQEQLPEFHQSLENASKLMLAQEGYPS